MPQEGNKRGPDEEFDRMLAEAGFRNVDDLLDRKKDIVFSRASLCNIRGNTEGGNDLQLETLKRFAEAIGKDPAVVLVRLGFIESTARLPGDEDVDKGSLPRWPVLGIVLALFAGLLYLYVTAEKGELEKEYGGVKKELEWQAQVRQETEASFDFLLADFFREGGIVLLSDPQVYKYVIQREKDVLRANAARASMGDLSQIELHEYGVVPLNIPDIVGRDSLDYLLGSGEQYVGKDEAYGVNSIAGLFWKIGKGDLLVVEQSRDFAYSPRHIISLGGWVSSAFSSGIVATDQHQEYLGRIPYRVHNGFVFHGRDTTDFRPEYVVDGGFCLNKDFALLTKVKNVWDGKTIIIVAGVNSQGTQATADLISSTERRNGEYRIERMRKYLGEEFDGEIPEWFQVVIEVPVKKSGMPGEDVRFRAAEGIDLN